MTPSDYINPEHNIPQSPEKKLNYEVSLDWKVNSVLKMINLISNSVPQSPVTIQSSIKLFIHEFNILTLYRTKIEKIENFRLKWK